MRLVPATLLLFLACEQPPTVAAPPAATPGMSDDKVVATWNGGQVTYGQLREKANTQLIRLEAEYLSNRHQVEQSALDEAVVSALLEEEAKARGLADIEALLQADISSKVADPSEEEVTALYEMVKRRMGGISLEELRPDIVGELRRRQEAELFEQYVVDLKARKGVVLDLPLPDIPRIPVSADDDPFMGPADAKVTIIQFADFQCPYCGQARPVISELLAKYPNDVRMVYRDFPLSGHDRAVPAAVAANCAGQQGKYWEMFDRLMDNQRALDDESLQSHAKDLGLNMKKWETCRKDEAQVVEVSKDQTDGMEAGVDGTPAFFVNGLLLSGAQTVEAFSEIIDREVAGG